MDRRQNVKVDADTVKQIKWLMKKTKRTRAGVLMVAVDAMYAEETRGKGYHG